MYVDFKIRSISWNKIYYRKITIATNDETDKKFQPKQPREKKDEKEVNHYISF